MYLYKVGTFIGTKSWLRMESRSILVLLESNKLAHGELVY
jgi:hypothetical protein